MRVTSHLLDVCMDTARENSSCREGPDVESFPLVAGDSLELLALSFRNGIDAL